MLLSLLRAHAAAEETVSFCAIALQPANMARGLRLVLDDVRSHAAKVRAELDTLATRRFGEGWRETRPIVAGPADDAAGLRLAIVGGQGLLAVICDVAERDDPELAARASVWRQARAQLLLDLDIALGVDVVH